MATKNLKFAQYLYKYPTYVSKEIVAYSTFDLGEDLCRKIANENKVDKVEIVSLGIQAPRGTRFQINGSNGVVGSTGKFELDKALLITQLSIGAKEDEAYYSNIIVDILYYEGA